MEISLISVTYVHMYSDVCNTKMASGKPDISFRGPRHYLPLMSLTSQEESFFFFLLITLLFRSTHTSKNEPS